ncbi:hypothetical protein SAMN04487890_102463 [Mucilaginibacter polytrichastri]|nr:hypothetical protein SAMN04487890_102463 [Mucilaginibacter polytrichastri]
MSTPLSTIIDKISTGTYILVEWPFVQDLMEYDWFRQECYLHQAFGDQPYLDSAYFVPLIRLIEINYFNQLQQ